jgi:hypothetical protein
MHCVPKTSPAGAKTTQFRHLYAPPHPTGCVCSGLAASSTSAPQTLTPLRHFSLSLSLYLSLSHTHTCLSLAPQVVVRANAAVTPQLVDRLLASREDISRADRAEAVKTCQEVYEALRTTR